MNYLFFPNTGSTNNNSDTDNGFKIFITAGGVIVKRGANNYVAWGQNTTGSLGNGSTTALPTPTSVSYAVDFAKIDGDSTWHAETNYVSTSGISNSGVAYGWGRNFYGELGIGSTTQQTTPQATTGGLLFSDISYGITANNSNSASPYVLAIEKDTGKLFSWGTAANYTGALARTTTNYSVPAFAHLSGSLTFSKVYAANISLAISTSGAIYQWGGVLAGTPTLVSDTQIYVNIMGTEPGRTSADKACFAMDASGKIYSWQPSSCTNPSGILGKGNTTSHSTPTEIVGSRTYSKMACGQKHAAAIESGTNRLYTWGNNSNGQLGDGTIVNKTSPTLIASDKQFASVACGTNFTVAVELGTNDIYVWGSNGNYRLGNNTTVGNTLTPTKLVLP